MLTNLYVENIIDCFVASFEIRLVPFDESDNIHHIAFKITCNSNLYTRQAICFEALLHNVVSYQLSSVQSRLCFISKSLTNC